MKATAVVVCYGPEVDRLRTMASVLHASGARAVFVDNSEPGVLSGMELPGDPVTIVNGENLGIAVAQNQGVRRALADGAELVAFFDQDSILHGGMLRELLAAADPSRAMVVAPVIRDEVRNFEFPSLVICPSGRRRKVYSNARTEPYPVDVVISSGMVATAKALTAAGSMDESLFIDSVDTEWCLRCRRRGVAIYIVPRAVMRHSVGSSSVELGFTIVAVHSPLRSYYQIRNSLLLLRNPNVPRLMAIREVTAVLGHKLLLLFTGGRSRREYLAAYFDGLRDGLRGASGRRLRAGT